MTERIRPTEEDFDAYVDTLFVDMAPEVADKNYSPSALEREIIGWLAIHFQDEPQLDAKYYKTRDSGKILDRILKVRGIRE